MIMKTRKIVKGNIWFTAKTTKLLYWFENNEGTIISRPYFSPYEILIVKHNFPFKKHFNDLYSIRKNNFYKKHLEEIK